MKLSNLFAKPVNRPIEGVIKADDEASLRLEIEEYVLTNEVEKRLEAFLDAYNNYEGANGVWVSGFFGSGKSHLLKMLAMLLEDRPIDGVSALELFLPKCGENEILRGDLKRAVAIPSRSILFNIDQKADVISKSQVDALLAVFVKVFDEMCGYFGKQPYIAQFERDLDRDGLLQPFRDEFSALAGRDWEWGRSRPARVSSFADQAFSKVTGQDSKDVLDKYRSDYRLSIEDFAEQIHTYVKRQGPEFRLNFFVDEVGQYIADNVKLMTNLQTIAESLATKCRGRAWVIVTSQNDMSTVLGEMNKQQSNDFSKIMARFATKMLLTSTNVSEVIQKRLLAKTEAGAEAVSDLYHKEANNFGTLFSFTDGSRDYKVYRDRDEFIRCYPFAPYQFELFQSSIENLSRHNAFEGKHSSVGERSMLAVFQQVAVQISGPSGGVPFSRSEQAETISDSLDDKLEKSGFQVGKLASFDLMFEGIRTALKSQTQRAILAAERQMGDAFAVKVLKALFLVKYVKEFKATLRNVCVLMLDGFNRDLPGLHKQVEQALNLLEQQDFVQRNGDIYEYLTDEEQDVQTEIKNTEVETSEVASELDKIIFDHVLKTRKIRYDESKQDYAFSRKLDDRLHGREYELAIHVVSPFHENAGNEDVIQMQNMGRDELLVLMPPDDRLLRDMLMYKRTEKYIRQTISVTQREEVKRILTDKGFQNRERYTNLQLRAKLLLGQSKLFVAGNLIDISGEDAHTRIVRGFHELIARVYPNLRMLRGVAYTENDIANCLNSSQESLFGNDAVALAESEQELLAAIQSNSRGGVRTTVKGLLEKFERKPYGWSFPGILCTLAKLCARGKVEARTDGNLLEEADLERALRNTQAHANTVLDPQVEFTASQIRALKEFYEDFFDSPPVASEAKALGNETAEAFRKMTGTLTPLAAQSARYPFLNALNPVLEKLAEVSGKPYTWYLTELRSREGALLDMKEKVIEPILKFMHGPQRDIFDNARSFVQTHQANFDYISDGNTPVLPIGEEDHTPANIPNDLIRTLNDPQCFKGTQMQQVKMWVDSLECQIDLCIKDEIDKATCIINSYREQITTMPEFSALDSANREMLLKPFDAVLADIRQQKLIAVIRDKVRHFKDTVYRDTVLRLSRAGDTGKAETGKTGSGDAVQVCAIESVMIPFGKPLLSTEEDVIQYTDAIRDALLAEIASGKRIQL